MFKKGVKKMGLKFNAANNRLMIVIPKETKLWVYEMAKKEKRSMNTYLLTLIDKAIKESKAA